MTTPFATACVRAGRTPDPTTGSIAPTLHQTTSFAQDGLGQDRGFTYTRAGNPTVAALEEALGHLEGAPPAVCQRTGMAAITSLFLAVLEGGDRLAIGRAVYGGTVRLAREILDPLGIEPLFFDPADGEETARTLAREPRLVLVETPANPTLELVDIAKIASAAHGAGALLAVDNTFQTAIGLRPLELGADLSVYSTTKWIEGHGSTVGGAVVSRDRGLLERIRRVTKSIGASQAPFDAWLTLRGLTTLPLRLQEHSSNALAVAKALESHPEALGVRHPGLPSFPQFELAERQHETGKGTPLHGGIVTFEVRGGYEGARRFLGALQHTLVAENLGTPETLATHPASMTHGDVPQEQRAAAGIVDGLVRLSVGLEDVDDTIEDLLRALDASADGAVTTGAARSQTTDEPVTGVAR